MTDLSSYAITGADNPNKQVSVTFWNGFVDALETAIDAAGGATVAISDVTDLQAALDGKQDSGSYASASSIALMAPQEWAPNFTAAGDLYIPATVAMTISQGNAKIGTGTITFTKSTAAAPSTFGAATLPVTLEAGAWLKVSAASVTGFVATHLKRTA